MALRLVCIVRKEDAWGRRARMAGKPCASACRLSLFGGGCLMGGGLAPRIEFL